MVSELLRKLVCSASLLGINRQHLFKIEKKVGRFAIKGKSCSLEAKSAFGEAFGFRTGIESFLTGRKLEDNTTESPDVDFIVESRLMFASP